MSFSDMDRDRAEFEAEHPEVSITYGPTESGTYTYEHIYDLARAWGKPACSLWLAREGGEVVAAGDGLADLLSGVRQKYGPTRAQQCRDILAQHRALVMRWSRLHDQRTQVRKELAQLGREVRKVNRECLKLDRELESLGYERVLGTHEVKDITS